LKASKLVCSCDARVLEERACESKCRRKNGSGARKPKSLEELLGHDSYIDSDFSEEIKRGVITQQDGICNWHELARNGKVRAKSLNQCHLMPTCLPRSSTFKVRQ
jgi:hypothetical protein